MATNCTPVICPTNCETLPIPKFRKCNPSWSFGNIAVLYWANVGYPLTDESDVTEWHARLNLPDNDPAKIIKLIVNAEQPDADVPEIDASGGRKAYGIPKRTITGEIDEVSDENYELMRNLRCGKTVLCWYEKLDGIAYGGPSGVEMSVKMGHVIPKTAQELENLPFTLTWQNEFDPCRFIHPLHGDNSDLDS